MLGGRPGLLEINSIEIWQVGVTGELSQDVVLAVQVLHGVRRHFQGLNSYSLTAWNKANSFRLFCLCLMYVSETGILGENRTQMRTLKH
jgi:hypothetical protein